MTRMVICTTGLIWNSQDRDHTTRQNMVHADEKAANNFVNFSRDWAKDLKVLKFSIEDIWHEQRHLGCSEGMAIQSLVEAELRLED